jgi:YD repeat-containing protein
MMDRMLTRVMPAITDVNPQVTTTWTYHSPTAPSTPSHQRQRHRLRLRYRRAPDLGRDHHSGFVGAKTISYQLDNNGNRTKLTWPDGYYVNYSYDSLNRMTQAADSAFTIQTYAWNALSRRSEQDDAGGGAGTELYTYSDAGDLLTLNHDLSGTADDVQYTLGYTNAHQLASEVSSLSNYNFAPPSNGTDSYAAVNSLNQYPAVKGVFYGYDSRGNLTGDGSFTYSYDPETHLILANATGNANTYAYDPLGRRVTKTVNATAVTNFLQDGDTEIAE